MFRLINVIKQINTKTILKLTNNDTAIVNAVSVNKYCQVKPTPTLKIDEDHLQDEFTGLGEEEQKKLKILQLEYDVWQSMGSHVPEHMATSHWHKLLALKSVHSRRNIYKFWAKTEATKRKAKEKSEIRKQEKAAKQADMEHLKDETGRLPLMNTLNMFVRESTMNHHYYNNMAHAMLYGQALIFDFGFEKEMRTRDLINLCDQMTLVHNANKYSRDPYHLHFCNVAEDSLTRQRLKLSLPNLDDMPLTVTSGGYCDLDIDKSRLVYLTPDSPNLLTTYSHDDVYIIGGLVDKTNVKPFTMAKAKRDGIRTAKLPIDKYLVWTLGSKRLALNHMIKILTEARDTDSDWNRAFSHIPKRKTMIKRNVATMYTKYETM